MSQAPSAAAATARDLKAEVKAAWATVAAPPAQDMAFMDWEYGPEAVQAFVGVRPVDVDLDSVGFLVATPLLDLPARAAAAYLGTYLIALLEGFQMEQALGFPVEIKPRVHTLYTMASPGFWVDIAAPHLDDACVAVLGKVARFVLTQKETFMLTDEEAWGLERVTRSVDRRLNAAGA